MEIVVIMSIDNEKLIKELNINVNNIYHLTFINGTEMIGELFDSSVDSEISECGIINSLLFLNPIKIIKEIFIDENNENINVEGYEEWNSSIEGPFTHIYINSILSQNVPNEKTLNNYLKSIHTLYCSEMINDEDVDVISIKDKKKNVSDFNKYHLKRMNGTF